MEGGAFLVFRSKHSRHGTHNTQQQQQQCIQTSTDASHAGAAYLILERRSPSQARTLKGIIPVLAAAVTDGKAGCIMAWHTVRDRRAPTNSHRYTLVEPIIAVQK